METAIEKQQKIQAPVLTDQDLISHLDNLGLTQKLTAGEKNTYLQIAKAFGLNPFKREIHVSKYGDQMSIITGYEVYIKRAERSGMLDGWDVTTSGSVEKGDLKATIKIHRKDRQHPFVWEALYRECVQRTKDGSVTRFWQKADFMIKKVAISQGFRLCFSDELGGMPYTEDEMPTHDVSYEEVPPSANNSNNTAPIKPTILPAENNQNNPGEDKKERQYRSVTNDAELIVELIENATDFGLLKTFQAVNTAFFKSNNELNEKLKAKYLELKGKSAQTNQPQPSNQ